jgi:hypothetical protein
MLAMTAAVLMAELRIDWELTGLCVLLAALIIAGCVAVVRVRRWRHVESTPLSVAEHLQSYQTLVERGELDPREFERIKARLEKRQEEKAAEPEPETGIQARRDPGAALSALPPDTRIQPAKDRKTDPPV